MTGTVLLTGGTGKTSTRIATKLQSCNIPVLLASRGKTQSASSPVAGFKTVKFDWFDETTYVNPFNEDKNIDAVYIIVPNPAIESAALVKKFIDFARQKGVGRFLLMSVHNIEKGSQLAHGQVHAYLENIGVDYAVLKPGWFFGNFLTASSVKSSNELISATGKGRTGFISEDDIADVAIDLLTASKLDGAESIIFGPELLSYDDIAEQLSQVLGRKITHRNVSAKERATEYVKEGKPEQVSVNLAVMEAQGIATFADEKMYNDPGVVKGKTHFIQFAEANKGSW